MANSLMLICSTKTNVKKWRFQGSHVMCDLGQKGQYSAANTAVLSRAIGRGSYRSFPRSISIRILRANVTGEPEDFSGAIFWRPSDVVTVSRPPKAEWVQKISLPSSSRSAVTASGYLAHMRLTQERMETKMTDL